MECGWVIAYAPEAALGPPLLRLLAGKPRHSQLCGSAAARRPHLRQRLGVGHVERGADMAVVQRVHQRVGYYVRAPAAVRPSGQPAAAARPGTRAHLRVPSHAKHGASDVHAYGPAVRERGRRASNAAPLHNVLQHQGSWQPAQHAGLRSPLGRRGRGAGRARLPALTSSAPRRMRPRKSPSTTPRVAGVSGSSTTTTSAPGSSAGSSARRAGAFAGLQTAAAHVMFAQLARLAPRAAPRHDACAQAVYNTCLKQGNL